MTITALEWVAKHCGSLMLLLMAAHGIGSVVVRGVSFSSRLERSIFAVATGAGLGSTVLLLLGFAGVLSPTLLRGLALVAAGVSGVRIATAGPAALAAFATWWRSAAPARRATACAATLLGVAYLALLGLRSLYPPVDYDAVWYHLPLAGTFLAEQRVVAVLGGGVPVLPVGAHLLFTWALAVGDDVLAQLLSYAFMVLVAVGTIAWGRRQGCTQMGVAAATLWLAHPLVLHLGGTAYVDLPLVGYAFLGVYALNVGWNARDLRWWSLGTLLLACAAAAKLPGAILLVLSLALALLACIGSRVPWRWLATAMAISLAVAGPVYGWVAFNTGNPLWPLFPQLSRSPWDSARVASWAARMRHFGLSKTPAHFLALSYYQVTEPARFSAPYGIAPVLVWWPLSWVVGWLDRRAGWWALWAFSYTVAWFFFSQELRHWLPALPMAGLALCESVRWLLGRIAAAIGRSVSIVATSAFLLAGSIGAVTQLADHPRVPTTHDEREAFLRKRLLGYRGAEYVNRHAGANDRVYGINCSRLNHYLEPAVVDRNSILERPTPTLRWPADEPLIRNLAGQGFSWILFCPTARYPFALPVDAERNPPYWPPYGLVYQDDEIWVYRRAAAPAARGNVRPPGVPGPRSDAASESRSPR